MLFRLILYIVELALFGAALKIPRPNVDQNHTSGMRKPNVDQNHTVGKRKPNADQNHTAGMRKPRIYFMIVGYNGLKNSNYQHMPVSLAEGLQDGGYYFRANINYWNQGLGEPYLFKNTTESPVKFDAFVVTYKLTDQIPQEVIDAREKHGRPKIVVLDWGDGHRIAYVGKRNLTFDIYYRAHYTEAYMPAKPKKPLLPSALYLTKRIVTAAKEAEERRIANHTKREKKYLWPHKTLMHPVRKFVEKHLLEELPPDMVARSKREVKTQTNADFFYWSATGRRHDSNFYDLMQTSQAMDCTAGHWHDDKLYQWDSFKLWEALGSSIAVVLPDLERYGMHFPVMPKKFIHYIPAVLENESLKTLAKNLTYDLDLVKIGRAGHHWAMTHYSPNAFALRFMKDVFPIFGKTLKPLPEEVETK